MSTPQSVSRLGKLLLIALLALGGAAEARRPQQQGGGAGVDGQPGQFDYYAVSLSWSPSFCASRNDPNQCASGRRLGFVLHGLWPQWQKGYPQSCSTQPLPAAVRAKYAGLFPSPGLIGHEWPKHGTCSGLEPAAYFELSAKLQKQLAIPPQFQAPSAPVRVTNAEFGAAFQRANPGLAAHAVLPFCSGDGRFLQELHACWGKDGASLSCSANELKRSKRSCGQDSFLLPSVR